MYLSRIVLDTQRRETMRALASPRMLHGAVEQSTGMPDSRSLWRIDWLAGVCYLLVLSHEAPDLAHIAKQFGPIDAECPFETKCYDPLLERLREGQAWRFRLCANPVHSSAQGPGKRGKVFAHVTREQQKQWLLARAASCGFALAEDGFDVVNSQWVEFPKRDEGGRSVTLRTATFEGKLTIEDAGLFQKTLLCGVGRAKAYGCGLLTIAPIKE